MTQIALRFLFVAGMALALQGPAYAQVYKWTDHSGEVHLSDSPYSIKESGGRANLIIPEKKRVAQVEPDTYIEEGPAATAIVETKSEESSDNQPKPVEVVGDIEIFASPRGLTTVRAAIKNNVDYPVDGIRLDVILYHVERKRAADLAIPFRGGKQRPDRLNAGETGVIEDEVEITPEEIAGYNYRLVWAFLEKVAPPGKDEPLPENVYHKVIPGVKRTEIQPSTEGVASDPSRKLK